MILSTARSSLWSIFPMSWPAEREKRNSGSGSLVLTALFSRMSDRWRAQFASPGNWDSQGHLGLSRYAWNGPWRSVGPCGTGHSVGTVRAEVVDVKIPRGQIRSHDFNWLCLSETRPLELTIANLL